MSGLVANPVTSMKELLSLIVSLKDDDEDKEGALETVLDYVEDIDLAKGRPSLFTGVSIVLSRIWKQGVQTEVS